MTMTHHDSRPYAQAVQEATDRFERLINQGPAKAKAVLDAIERQVPTDAIVAARAMNVTNEITSFVANPKDPEGPSVGRRSLLLGWNESKVGLHDHALQQMSERAQVPWSFVQRLRGMNGDGWGGDLIAHNLNEIIRRGSNRFLVRTVDGEARGILSDKFRRLDSRPIVDAFVGAASKIGALPVDGSALETRVDLKAIIPVLHKPAGDTGIAFGMSISNSDFGDGALSVRAFILRAWCTNYAVTEEALRQVHLGARLDENFAFSERTYRLDTERMASAVDDVVTGLLGPEAVAGMLARIEASNNARVDARAVAGFFDKHLTKEEAKAATEAFASPDVENLPPGQSAWRMSNAVSWIANAENVDARRRLDLQRVAGLALVGGEKN